MERSAAKRQECIVNPKTSKPYTKHLYHQHNLRVKAYTQMWSGEIAPTQFAGELVCQRCGREVHFEY